METENNLSRTILEIVNLRWDNKFEGALQLYRKQIAPAMNKVEVAENNALVGAICDSLKNTGQIAAAIQFVSAYLHLQPNSEKIHLKLIVNLAWLYYTWLHNKNDHVIKLSEEQIQQCHALLERLSEARETKVMNLLFFAFADSFIAQNPQQWVQVLELTEKFDATHFSDEEGKITRKTGVGTKEEAIASALEKWWILRVKARYHTSQYNDCIRLGTLLLEGQIQKFHHGNHLWVTRLIAKSFQQTGNIHQAIHHLELILKKRREWFIQMELASCYLQAAMKDEAIACYRDAFINGGHSPYKVGLYEQMMPVFEAAGAQALLHKLVVQTRKNEGWPIPIKLRLGMETTGDEDPLLLYRQLKTLLQPAGNAEYHSKNQMKHDKGVVTRILHDNENGDGFITALDGTSVYFRFSQTLIPYSAIKTGLEVSFKAVQSTVGGSNRWQAKKVFISEKK